MTNILLTGATGFVGSALLEKIKDRYQVDLLVRKHIEREGSNIFVADLNPTSDYADALNEKEVVVHCAARVHVMNDKESNPLEAFRYTNTLGTENLALQAAQAGVSKFIFISSIKVNGEETFDEAFTSADDNNPIDDYGQSKAEAEELLLKIGEKTGMEIIIIRPPLVYGPGVKANFGALVKLINKGLPLPFGAIKDNKRSMVYIGNLVDFIATTISHSKTANNVYLISDDYDLSTAQLVTAIAKGLNKRLLNIPLPVFLFELVGKLTGKQAVVSRLVGSLQVNIEQSKNDFSWSPPFSCEKGIAITANSFIKQG